MLGIICALRFEVPRLGAGAAGAVVAASGPGPANVTRTAEELVASCRLDGLVSAGYAGALVPQLRVGDLVVDTEVPHWKALASRPGVRLGRVATVNHVVQTVAERRALASSTGALAVDMESAAVADVARRHALPWAAVRAISDVAERDLLLDWNRCRRQDGSFRLWPLCAQLLRKPQGVAEIRQLWYASRIASRSLGDFLRELLGSNGRFAFGRQIA